MSIRARRGFTRVCIAISFAALAADAFVPGFRHISIGGGLLVFVCAPLGILGGLAYLRSTGGQR